jgi:LytS/YehU family sensor histidine kinase
LRSCFDFGELDSLIPLERELDLVYSYVSIEKARFGDDLTVNYELDDIDFMVPSFLLQPLVENAIDNGVRKSLIVGEITIYIRKLEQELIIGVRNNGTEIEQYEQDAIYENTVNKGAGLSCINQKLNKIYKTSLMIETIPTGGNDIYMKLPLDGRKV